MRGEGVRASTTLFLYSKHHRRDNCRVWQAGRVEVQDAHILLVAFVITDIDRADRGVERSAQAAVLA